MPSWAWRRCRLPGRAEPVSHAHRGVRAARRLLLILGAGLLPALTAGCGSVGPAQLSTTIEPGSGAPARGERPAAVKPGDTATYRIIVVNNGPDFASGVNVRAELPADFTYRTTVSFGGDAARTQPVDPDVHSSQPQWGVWSLAAPRVNEDGTTHNSQLVVTFVADIKGRPDNYAIQARATGDNLEEESQAPPLAVELASAPDVTLNVSVSPTTTHRSQEVTYTIAVQNKGTAPSSGVGVLITLPPVLAFSTTAAITGNFSRSKPVDPLRNAVIVFYGGFSVPPAGDGGPGTLNILFRARCADTPVAGKFPVTAQLTDDAGTVVTVPDGSPVQVIP